MTNQQLRDAIRPLLDFAGDWLGNHPTVFKEQYSPQTMRDQLKQQVKRLQAYVEELEKTDPAVFLQRLEQPNCQIMCRRHLRSGEELFHIDAKTTCPLVGTCHVVMTLDANLVTELFYKANKMALDKYYRSFVLTQPEAPSDSSPEPAGDDSESSRSD